MADGGWSGDLPVPIRLEVLEVGGRQREGEQQSLRHTSVLPWTSPLMFTRPAQLTVRRRRAVLVLSALFVVVAAGVGVRVFGDLSSGGFEDPGSESYRAVRDLEDDLGAGDPDLVLLVAATDGNVDEPAAAAAGSELTAALATEPHVTQAVSYWSLGGLVALRDDAGDSALVVVDLEGSDDEIDEVISRIDAIYAGERGPITVGVGGPEAVTAAIGEQTATSPDHSTSPPPASSTSPCPS